MPNSTLKLLTHSRMAKLQGGSRQGRRLKAGVALPFRLMAFGMVIASAMGVSGQGGIDLKGVPGPYVFSHYCVLKSGEFWAAGGAGSVHAIFADGTERVSNPTQAALEAICVTEEGAGWAVGESGTILRTDDKGISWAQQKSGVITDLKSVFCLNAHRAWAVGTKGTAVTTDDGGNRWRTVPLGAKNDLHAVYFLNQAEGWACGEDGIIATTRDGGNTWRIQYVKRPIFPGNPSMGCSEWRSVRFASARLGWVTGPTWVATTHDGGDTWHCTPLHLSGSYSGIGVVSQTGTRVWAIDQYGDNYCSEDGGSSWRPCRKT